MCSTSPRLPCQGAAACSILHFQCCIFRQPALECRALHHPVQALTGYIFRPKGHSVSNVMNVHISSHSRSVKHGSVQKAKGKQCLDFRLHDVFNKCGDVFIQRLIAREQTLIVGILIKTLQTLALWCVC